MGMHVPRRVCGFLVVQALVFFGFGALPAAANCAGADPAILSVAVKSIATVDGLNRYTLRGKVANVGHVAQSPGTLQFVDIYKGHTKLDSRGVPPLRAGQSYAFEYTSKRSISAGRGTTALAFRMNVRGEASQDARDCNTGNGVMMVRF